MPTAIGALLNLLPYELRAEVETIVALNGSSRGAGTSEPGAPPRSLGDDEAAGIQTWAAIAHLLARELAEREERLHKLGLQKVKDQGLLQRFRDRLKKAQAGSGTDWCSVSSPGTAPATPTGGHESEGSPQDEVVMPTSAAGISMLIVEPNPEDARTLENHCADAGYKCTVVGSGEAAVECMRSFQGRSNGRFDVVLSSTSLPDMPGFKLLQEARKALTERVAVIMTSWPDKDSTMVERCILDGADSYIVKPALKKELAALWGFVARRRQQFISQSNSKGSLHQAIQRVEDELVVPSLSSSSLEEASAKPQARKLLHSRSAMWLEKFKDDFQADLRDAQLFQIPSHDDSSFTKVAPQLQTAIQNATATLLEVSHPEKRKSTRRNSKSYSAEALAAANSFGQREGTSAGVEKKLTREAAAPSSSKLGNQDYAEIRKMLLERRNALEKQGKSGLAVASMLELLNDESQVTEFDAPDSMLICRLCEEKVLSSAFKVHTAICEAKHRTNNEDEALNQEVSDLRTLLQNSIKQAMQFLVTMAVQRHNLLSKPLVQMIDLCEQATGAVKQNMSPLYRIGHLTELARKLAQLKSAEHASLGGSVFYTCVSQLKGIIAEKISHVQQLIDLDPRTLDLKDGKPIFSRAGSMTRKLGIKDFTLLRLLASGGFAQVWLAKKKSTGDMMAIKAMRKEHLRETHQVLSINVEHAILGRHESKFLVRAFYSFRSAHHIYFALEYMPGGDLSAMLDECGCISQDHTAFYLSEVLLGMHYLHSQDILHRDIKPSNVLIGAKGHIKLADFGLSTSMTAKKQSGTLPYVAPEVLRDVAGQEGIDHWSVGIVASELLMGFLPFRGETPAQMLRSIESTVLCLDGVSAEADSLIRGLLTVDVSKRLGRSGFNEIKEHPFFSSTNWDDLENATPPFVPELQGEGDDSYFPQPKCGAGTKPISDSSTEDDSDSESFKMIQGTNFRQLLTLSPHSPARRASAPAINLGNSFRAAHNG